MAQELAIAKAALSASLFRADPTSLSRPQVEALFPLIDAAVKQCSRPNVQNCKDWIINNIAFSSARLTALGRYLAALSKGLKEEGSKPSVKRRKLHVLYLVNDVAHHVVAQQVGESQRLSTAWDIHLPTMAASAAAFDRIPKQREKLDSLVDLWEEKFYFTPELIAKIREALINGTAPATDQSSSTATQKPHKKAPFVLPAYHGDPSTPWYDLPAGNWLPHITPNSTKPMNPHVIRPIQLKAGPAPKHLVDSVEGLLADVERMYSKDRKWRDEPNVDINELGERVVLDEITGDIIGGDTYYGWSRSFCAKMKERKKNAKLGKRGPLPARSRSRSFSPAARRSYSRSSSRSPRGRSPDSSGAPAFKRARRSPYSRSPSPRRSESPPRGFDRGRRSRDSPSRSRSRSHARSHSRRNRNRSHSRGSARSRSRSRSYQDNNPVHYQPPPPPPAPHAFPPHQGNPPFHGFPPMPVPGGFPPPPPPPTGYNGHWPPPPPHHMGGLPPPPPPQNWYAGGMPPNMAGQWGSGPPPPPPPPALNPGGGPPQQYQGGNYGRGNAGFRGRGRGRGRGGYDRNQGWQ